MHTTQDYSKRFFLDNDNDGHWYIIPVDKISEWEEWSNLSEDNEDSWDTPDFAIPIGGSPTLITFEKWENHSPF